MIVPKPLKVGDKIGIAAPAGIFEITELEKGLAVINQMGLVPVVDDDVYKRDRYMAGTDQHRARHLNRLFANDDIKAIICARGGFGCLRVLPFLDYELIREHPKMLIGFSDVTALLVTLGQRSGLAGVHGPTVTSLGAGDEQSRERLQTVLADYGPVDLEPESPVVIQSGVACGVLVGGNLATLCHLVGTPFALDLAGKVVLIEDVNEAPYRIDRMLTQMRMAGCFQGMAGLVLGSFESCGTKEEVLQVIEDVFADFKGPILGGFEIGHGKKNMSVRVGTKVALNTNPPSLRFL